MFDKNSRYAGLTLIQYIDTANHVIDYVPRRFSPQPNSMPILTQTTLGDQERIDQVANRTLGNPLLFWLVADANTGLNPWDLVKTAGVTLTIPQPQS